MTSDLERRLESLLHEEADVEPPERLIRRVGSIPAERRSRSGATPAVRLGALVIVIIGLVGAGVIIPRLVPTPAPIGASDSVPPTTAVAVSPSSLSAVGCGPAAVVTMPTDNDPTLLAFGPIAEAPLEGLAVTPADPLVEAFVQALAPPEPPAGSSLRRSLLLPWAAAGATDETRLLFVYAQSNTDGLSAQGVIAAGGWILAEAPARGHDALSIQKGFDSIGGQGHYAIVQVGPHQAILVHESAQTPLGRPYGLHWSDGTRDLSLKAAAPSNQVIDFARSLYCH